MFGKATSDPFVTIKFGGGVGNTDKLKSESDVVKKSLNPRQVNAFNTTQHNRSLIYLLLFWSADG